jgi:hypothetical protein
MYNYGRYNLTKLYYTNQTFYTAFNTQIQYLQYLGLWYEYSNYFAIFQAFQDCVSALYTDETPTSSYAGTRPAPKLGVLNRGRNVL